MTENDNGVFTTYSYDAKNKVASVTANGITTHYRYNLNGTRTAKDLLGSTSHFVFDEESDQILLRARQEPGALVAHAEICARGTE